MTTPRRIRRVRLPGGQLKCIFPGCRKPEACKGNCDTHYHTAAQQVHRKKITWEELEAAGRMLPPKKRGRKSTVSDWFLKGVKPT